MADEITLSFNLLFAKGNVRENPKMTSLKIDVSGTQLIHHIQTIGTSEEALTVGDISTGGWFVGINRDDTNTISIRPGTGTNSLIDMKPGEPCVFRSSASGELAIWALADTAACELEYWMIED
jgi:hypothetical protein